MTKYISYPFLPDSLGEGRSASNASFESDTGANWVAEVDSVAAGETEIDVATFNAKTAANIAHNAALPPPVPPVPPPDKNAILKQSVLAATTTDDLKAALAAWLNGG